MTAKKDLKKRVRERAARTGESYTTAREHVVGKVARGGFLVVETRDLSEEAARLGIRCPVRMFAELARRVDSSAVLVRLRDVLRATEQDPGTELLRAVVLRGAQPELPLAYRSVTGGGDEEFAARARAGIGGVSERGTTLALPVAGRKGFEMVVCELCLSPPPSEAALRAIFEEIGKTAPSTGHVLITDENGNGKNLVARAIHDSSKRAGGPFIHLDCAAIPAELIESELFGHERGAFTGATVQRRGRFELAAGGTLFLDGVSHLSPAAQARLLRFLKRGKVERVGGDRSIVIDARVVAATNKNLAEEIAAGRFREDLHHQLNGVPIDLATLRAYRPASLLLLGPDDFPLFQVESPPTRP
jgi:transcriptional regulator of aromatic amino acid metabolism